MAEKIRNTDGVGGEQAAPSVLIAEDDRAARESLVRALKLDGYHVRSAEDGVTALSLARARRPDVLLLDVAMPNGDGLFVARTLRNEGDTLPILMLTARTEVGERVAGLDAGADDYLPKPYHLDELIARMSALLRRANATVINTPSQEDLVVGDLRIDRDGRQAFRGDRELGLSKTEFDLLELLMEHANNVLDRATIHRAIWGADFGAGSKNLAVFIGYLRRKTEIEDLPRLVHTVRGEGYVVRAAGSS